MILVLDFGSQYTQLIARRVREQHVYCEIHPYNVSIETVRKLAPEGIIFSGGPSSVYAEGAPLPDKAILDVGVPVLGICYGMNVLNFLAGGKVARATHREYGAAKITIDDQSDLFHGIAGEVDGSTVWMSHGDRMESLAPGWKVIAHSGNSPIAACADVGNQRWGIQFHPEVHHSERGTDVLRSFVFGICKAEANWTMENFVGQEVEKIREQVGHEKVICALSGGVDSAVAAAIIDRAVGDKLTCVFVDNGVLRAGEAERVAEAFRGRFGDRLKVIDARKQFLDALKNVEDPEVKRKAIGRVFIEVFEAEAKRIPGVAYLAQGTLYPDVIESVSFKGPSATIKSHHNVGGLPERMHLKLVEPLRELFKDEVRELGKLVDVPDEILQRQPFPGPGLAIRILGTVTEERLFILRAVDTIVVSEIKAAGLYRKIWQSFAVLLPVKTVGVMGDERTYENVIAIRAVESVDGMTADWARLPYDLLAHLSNRIINEVAGVNRVVYDVSSKPPATIEWE
jgi:GMP synthase (glutamine-hydrolysing)